MLGRTYGPYTTGPVSAPVLEAVVAEIDFWQRYGRHLGIGLVSSIYVLNPEAVIIGGSSSAAAPCFSEVTQAETNQRIHPSYRSYLKLLTATLGNRAGMIGSAKLAIDYIS